MKEFFFSVVKIPTDNIPRATGDQIANGLVNGTFILAGAIAVIVLIYSGIRYVTSQGDAAKLQKAKEGIRYAIIGLIVVVAAFAIVRFVSDAVTSGV